MDQIREIAGWLPISAYTQKPYTQKRLYRKAPIPKMDQIREIAGWLPISAYTQKPYTQKRLYRKAPIPKSFRVIWPRIRADNPNLNIV
jgi:hypothetical protein